MKRVVGWGDPTKKPSSFIPSKVFYGSNKLVPISIFSVQLNEVPQCSTVLVSRKKMYKICHYTHHFIWCFAHWNLVSNKYFNYALLSKCNFSDFQYWNLDQNESLRGKKAVFCVSCPNCTSQNLKIEFCITTCDVTKNFY